MSEPTRSPYDPYDSHDPHAEPYPASASYAVPYPRSYFDDPYEPYEASAYSDDRYGDRYHGDQYYDDQYYGEQDGGHGYVQQPLYEAPDDLHGVPDDHREPPRDTAADPDPDPVRMPRSVRAAQIIAWVAGGIGIAVIAAVAVLTGDPERLGAAVAGSAVQLVLGACAFAFAAGRGGLRTMVIALAILEAFCGFGSMGAMQPPGLLGMVVGIVLLCLMLGRSAAEWFNRPRGV